MNILDMDFNTRFEQAKAIFESYAGVKLQPYDAETLILQVVCAMIQQSAESMNAQANMIFFENMDSETLNNYGANIGVSRLPSQSAKTLLRFTISNAVTYPITIFEKTKVSGAGSNGTFDFYTAENAVIEAGKTYIDVFAYEIKPDSTNSGSLANGMERGTINQLTSNTEVYPETLTVANILVSYDGYNFETDSRYIERLKNIKTGYKNLIMSLTTKIVDALVYNQDFSVKAICLPLGWNGSQNELLLGDTTYLDNFVFSYPYQNSATGLYYWKLTKSGSDYTFYVYSDLAKTQLIDSGTRTGIGTITGTNSFFSVDVLTGAVSVDTAECIIDSIHTEFAKITALKTSNNEYFPINDVLLLSAPEKVAVAISAINITLNKSFNSVTITNQVNEIVSNYSNNTLLTQLGNDVSCSYLESQIQQLAGVKLVTVILDSDTSKRLVAIEKHQAPIISFSTSNVNITVEV